MRKKGCPYQATEIEGLIVFEVEQDIKVGLDLVKIPWQEHLEKKRHQIEEEGRTPIPSGNHHVNNEKCHSCSDSEIVSPLCFPSPTTHLSSEGIEELKACIRDINQFLLGLALAGNPDDTMALRDKFKKLCGLFVAVKVLCRGREQIVAGIVQHVGKDFLVLDVIEHQAFILFDHIGQVHQKQGARWYQYHQGLHDIDACLRRDLVQNFGETVAGNPFLLNQFTGLHFHLFFVHFIDCKLEIIAGDREKPLRGILSDVDQDSIVVVIDGDIEKVNLDDICFTKVFA